MSADPWDIARSVAAVLSLIISMIALVLARRDKSGETERRTLERMDGLSMRLTSLEEAVKGMPSHRDIDVLQNSIALVGQRVAKLEGSIEANTRMCERINQYLLEGGK